LRLYSRLVRDGPFRVKVDLNVETRSQAPAPALGPAHTDGGIKKRDWSRDAFRGVSWSPPDLCRDPPPGKRLSTWGKEVWAARFEQRTAAGFVEPLSSLLGEPMKRSRYDAGRFYNTPGGELFLIYDRRRGAPRDISWDGRVVVEHWPIADSEFAPHAARAVLDMLEDREYDRRVYTRNGWCLGPFGFTLWLSRAHGRGGA
jgi:hypothetical protein